VSNIEIAKQYFDDATSLIKADNWSEATELLRQAQVYAPQRRSIRLNLVAALIHLERRAEAEQSLREALSMFPEDGQFIYLLARLLLEIKPEESLKLAKTIMAQENLGLEDLMSLGLLFSDLGCGPEALDTFERAEKFATLPLIGIIGKARALSRVSKYEEALELIGNTITVQTNVEDLLLERAHILEASGDIVGSLSQYDDLLAANPALVEALINRGNVLNSLGRFAHAAIDLKKALALTANPEPIALFNLSKSYNGLKEHDKAIQVLEELVTLCPAYPSAKGVLLHQKMLCCDWQDYDRLVREIQADLISGITAAEPFGIQAWADSEFLIHKAVTLYTQKFYPSSESDYKQSRNSSGRIRIGYVCGEYREHATMILMEGVFKAHDKKTFELYGFSTTAPSPTDYSRRILSYFESFHFIHNLGDQQASELIRSLGIDILINLNGYYGAYRMGLFSLRPAPIQINFLGFPGTLGASYMDYIIADKTVVPKDSAQFYSEKIIYLPRCYQPNNEMRPAFNSSYSKTMLGLTPSEFVFASFNNIYKLTPTHFTLWLKILEINPHSVLVLLLDNVCGRENVLKITDANGIDSSRIKFLERCGLAEHLARHQAVDIFLDTAPYTGHTTLSDAIWMGVPTISLIGTTFPGRVSKSLLSAVAMDDLVVRTPEEYLALATRVAHDPKFLTDLRERLARGIKASKLFDPIGYTLELEAALRDISISALSS
jgi:predicted O-linked N-acetylglucosamine transferase (SPINDLY family)